MPWTSNDRIPSQQSKSSPALAEFRGELHLCHAGDSSNDIWHSVFDGAEWSTNDRIPDQKSKAPSALASFQNRLHITHLGDSSNRIWHSSFDGTRWTTNEAIEGELSQAAPAMAVFADRLHLLHIGNSSHRIYHLEFDGLRWEKRAANEGLENQRSKGPVALAEFNGELHMVHQGDTSNRLWHTRFNGTRWSENEVIDGQLSRSAPALATLNGLLHLLHLGNSSNRIWHSTFGGSMWEPNIPIPYQLSKAAPGLAASGNRLHMAHLGDSSNDIWYSSSDGVLVRRPERRVVVIDLDGVRWDSFYRHLKRVSDAGASTDVTYNFTLPPGASDGTLLEDGDVQLRSALAELCFAEGNGMADVRLALAPYPSFTFPSHGTMYTGFGAGRHGIAGHTFMVRDAPPEWDRHSWDSLPRALALQGYCTDAESSGAALADYLWGGFDTVDGNSCRNRNRGLVSDLRVTNMFEHAHESGLRSCSIHSFYHGALRPWENEGRDQWLRHSPRELRSIKDVCSEEDIDQYETIDHGALVKAELLLESMPSKLQVISPSTSIPASIPDSADPMTGERRPGWIVRGEAHPDGIPDLVAIYLASVDNASHINGIRDQETYLAWFDHRLGRYVRALKRADPDTFENTIFAFVADHGHAPIAQAPESSGVPSDNTLAVREELVRIFLGDVEGNAFLALAKTVSEMNHGLSYGGLVSDAIEDGCAAWAEAMNLYVYVRDPDKFPPIDVARRLLAIPMRTEPYGALVLVRGQYQFLARGETSPAPLDSAASRAFVIPQLDVPAASTAEIDTTSLSPAAAAAEQSLRVRLGTDEAFELLQVAERVAGFHPVGTNQSPDVILLAPAGRSFSGGAATHGSFAYSTSRIPMVFCGPGMPSGRVQIDDARMIDFAPTVLSLLGVTPEGLEGRPLLDRSGQVVRGPIPGGPVSKPCVSSGPAGRRPSTAVPTRRLPRVTVVLHPSLRRPASTTEMDAADLPVLVAITLHAGRVRREVVLGEALYVEARSAMTLVAGRGETWMEAEGKRQVLKTGTQIPLLARKRIRIRSEHSFGSIDVERAYIVQPLLVGLPRVPGWLRRGIEVLADAGRILIDDRQIADGSILVPAEDFARTVEILEAQLGGDPRSDRLAESRLPDMAKFKRAVRILESILDKPTVSGLNTTPGHLYTQ